MRKVQIIAEIGINHNGDMELAKDLIEQAEDAGADIAKFQLYDVDKLFPDQQIIARKRNWYGLVKKTQLTKDQIFMLAEYCKKTRIGFLCSAFDTERLGWLEELGVTRHKIAYRMRNDLNYVDAVVSTGKPSIISVGNVTRFPYSSRLGKIDYLYCVPMYPTLAKDLSLDKIDFSKYSGFSDHSVGIVASMVAISRGAKIIEKHFTFNRFCELGPDHICSIEHGELRALVKFAAATEEMI